MYTYTWKKYLPVIRLLLKRSAAEEQLLTLSRMDFERNSRLRKPVCSFSIELIKGRLSKLNPSAPAKDLLDILMQDDIARALLRLHDYNISLNPDFQLSIKNCTPITEPAVETGQQPDEAPAEKKQEIEAPVANQELNDEDPAQ